MKKLVITMLFILAPFLAQAVGEAYIGGVWKDPKVNSRAVIKQNGNIITITNSFTYQGKEVEWSGSGTVNRTDVTFNYSYTKNRPAGWEDGTMSLKYIGKGTMTGSWTSSSGKFSMPIAFMLIKKDKKEEVKAESAKIPELKIKSAPKIYIPPANPGRPTDDREPDQYAPDYNGPGR